MDIKISILQPINPKKNPDSLFNIKKEEEEEETNTTKELARCKQPRACLGPAFMLLWWNATFFFLLIFFLGKQTGD